MDRVPRPEDFNDPSMMRGGGSMPNFSSQEGNLFSLLSAMGGSQPAPEIRRQDESAFDPTAGRGGGMGMEPPMASPQQMGGRAPGGDFSSAMADPFAAMGMMNPADQAMGAMNPMAKRQALAKLLLRAKSGQRF